MRRIKFRVLRVVPYYLHYPIITFSREIIQFPLGCSVLRRKHKHDAVSSLLGSVLRGELRAPRHVASGTLFSTTLSTLQRKSSLCIPFLGIARPQSQFPHSCVCERFIYSQDRSTFSINHSILSILQEQIARNEKDKKE